MFAGFGTPVAGARFALVLGGQFVTTRGPRHAGAAGTTWRVTGHGYDATRRVMVLLTSQTDVEVAISLDELRLSFRPVEETGGKGKGAPTARPVRADNGEGRREPLRWSRSAPRPEARRCLPVRGCGAERVFRRTPP